MFKQLVRLRFRRMADMMASHETLYLDLSKRSVDEYSVLPWFSYLISLPADLPPAASRPHLRTKRLLIRPFEPSDADALFKLRRDKQLQSCSNARGVPDRSLEQTQQSIANLQDPYDETHWYFGAFLADSNGNTHELIGEGGLPDIEGRTTRSGWPEVDFLISPAYQRQGYGTELFQAVMGSWWALPRERRRRQLHPYVVDKDSVPGTKMQDCVVIVLEDTNEKGKRFFDKMVQLGTKVGNGGDASGAGVLDYAVALRATFEDYDMREGRRRELTKWWGMTLTNPIVFVDEESSDSGVDE